MIGGVELSSSEGTTQGDPVAMAIYATAVIPLILMVLEIFNDKPLDSAAKSDAYADDLAAGGSLESLLLWWKTLNDLGPLFGYYPEETKSWLIVKPKFESDAKRIFKETKINITREGKKHLGAVIGTESFIDEYVDQKLEEIVDELRILVEITKIEPQAAYAAFVAGFRHKLTYMMRTIPNIGQHLSKIDNIVSNEFIPALMGGKIVNDSERKLLSMPVKYGGLALPIFAQISDLEFYNSTLITKDLCTRIKTQQREYSKDKDVSVKKKHIAEQKKERHNNLLMDLRQEMTDDKIRLLELSQEIGASSWLSVLPLTDEGYVLNKQCFQDLLRFRYGWVLKNFPSTCECGANFSVDHALTCKKGGFVSIRHNEVRNITASLLKEVCHDVRVEPPLQPVVGEDLPSNSNLADEARLDICARGFWASGQMAFYDVRVFNPLAKRYRNIPLPKCYQVNEKEKKVKYNNRIIEIEHGTLTPLVFSATGGMGRECEKFFARLSIKVAEKRNVEYGKVTAWIRRKLSFALVRTAHMCIRGSRDVHKTNDLFELDPESSESFARI